MDYSERLRTLLHRLSSALQDEHEDQHPARGLGNLATEIRILGQSALLLANLPFPIAGTMDLDALITGEFWVQKKLESLLIEMGIRLESDAHLIWMPPETNYCLWLEAPFLRVYLADADAIIASKFVTEGF